MNTALALLPVQQPASSEPPAPGKEKRLVKTTHFCFECKVPFTRPMLQWHLRNDHRLIGCKICGARVTTFLSNDSLHSNKAHFCSQNCRITAVARRLCPRCVKPLESPVRGLGLGLCRDCTRSQDYTLEQVRAIDEILESMEVRRSC
jgi:hypothetical protein